MHSLQQHRRRPRGTYRIGIGLLIGCALLVAFTRPAWLERFFLDTLVSTSFVREVVADTADDVRVGMMSMRDVVDEIRALRGENAALRVRAALYDDVVADRNRLYQRFGWDMAVVGTIAHVVAAPTRSPYDTFVLDRGSTAGVREGDIVWFDHTIALGKVEQVSDAASRVRLFSSPGYEQYVSVGTSSAMVSAVGRGGGSFELTVPKDIPVALDEPLYSIDVTLGVLGFVRDIKARDADSFQTVYAASPINLFETREVFIRRSVF